MEGEFEYVQTLVFEIKTMKKIEPYKETSSLVAEQSKDQACQKRKLFIHLST